MIKDDLTILGKGAVLRPPVAFHQNLCSGLAGGGTEAGICMQGTDVKLDDFLVEHRKVRSAPKPIRNVTISGMEVVGFDLNIAVVGASNTKIKSNILREGEAYGLLSDGSNDTLSYNNTVVSSSSLNSIGICNDNPKGALVSHNYVSGSVFGLCIQTENAEVHDNDCHDNCFGVFVDPHHSGARLLHNRISSPRSACPSPGFASPAIPFSAVGISVSGASDTLVYENTVVTNACDVGAAGIVVVDDPCTEQAISCLTNPIQSLASNNKVARNFLLGNNPDLYIVSTLRSNIAEGNTCLISEPKGICSKE